MNATTNDDFTNQAKDKYDEIVKKEKLLKKQIAEIQAEKKSLKSYLVAIGVLEIKARKKQQPKAN